jgi:hypothetical protein
MPSAVQDEQLRLGASIEPVETSHDPQPRYWTPRDPIILHHPPWLVGGLLSAKSPIKTFPFQTYIEQDKESRMKSERSCCRKADWELGIG